MLERLLSLLEQGEVRSTADLARTLGVSQGMVEHMLFFLVRLGRLEELDGCNGAACRGCPSAQTCAPARPVKLWRVVP